MISSCLCLGLSSGLSPSGFSTKNLFVFFVSYLSATRPSYNELPMDCFLNNTIQIFISTFQFFGILFKIAFLLMPDLRGNSFLTCLLTLILSTLLVLPYMLYVFPSTSPFITLIFFFIRSTNHEFPHYSGLRFLPLMPKCAPPHPRF